MHAPGAVSEPAHQLLRREQLFTERVGSGGFVMALLFIGVLYALPGLAAFLNPAPIGPAPMALALGADLVADGIWRQVCHVNDLGDLLRYLSFAVVAGLAWAYVVPGLVLLIDLQRIGQKERQMGRSMRLLRPARAAAPVWCPG